MKKMKEIKTELSSGTGQKMEKSLSIGKKALPETYNSQEFSLKTYNSQENI